MAEAWLGGSLGAVLAAATLAAVRDGGAPAPRLARADLSQCEGCEGAQERDAGALSWSTRIGPGVDRGEPLRLEGTVYAVDGRTPAPGVVVSAYQTNAYRRARLNQGGDGIVTLTRAPDGTWLARRDLVLEPHPR